MNWAGAIDRNSTALKAIIDTLFALLGLATRLSPSVYRRILRSLRPAESALRRLIVIAARNLVVELTPPRVKPTSAKPVSVKPKMSIEGSRSTVNPTFRLFDPRKPFRMIAKRKRFRFIPRIHVLDWSYDPRISAQFPPPRPPTPPAPPPPPPPDGLVDASRITRRLLALELALDDIPGQALRLARLQKRREANPGPIFKTPIRPGHPPGYRRRKRREVDDILMECHYLAIDGLKVDTS